MRKMFDEKKIPPTLDEFCEYVDLHGYDLNPVALYKELDAKGWVNKKGEVAKSWTALVCARNGIICQKKHNEELAKLGLRKKAKYESKQKTTLRIAKAKTKDVKIHYREYLKDHRWYAFRELAFAVRGRKCERCNSPAYLQVHHVKYREGLLPWEYSVKEVMVLCRDCHAKIHGIK